MSVGKAPRNVREVIRKGRGGPEEVIEQDVAYRIHWRDGELAEPG